MTHLSIQHRALLIFAACAAALFLVVSFAHAHEERIYVVGEEMYSVTVGWADEEPVIAGERNGIEVMIFGAVIDEENDDVFLVPVEGIAGDIALTVRAAGEEKQFTLTAGEAPGSYHAMIYPLHAGEYGVVVEGSIDGREARFVFACDPAGHRLERELQPGTDLFGEFEFLGGQGSFECPVDRAAFSVPAPAGPVSGEVAERFDAVDVAAARAFERASETRLFGIAGILFGALGFFFGATALMKRRKEEEL